jgi:phosphoserine phosphatase
VQLVTLDLDGTLIRSTVFQAAGHALGYGEYIDYVDELYEQGTIGLKAAFYAEYPLFLNHSIDEVHQALATGDWLDRIAGTVEALQDPGVDVWVVTDQPDWAVSYLERFGIHEGVYTETSRWEGDRIGAATTIRFGKRPALAAKLEERGIDPDDVVHVGNGTNDVPVFDLVNRGVAFNPSSPAVSEAASATVASDTLADLLGAL